MSLGPVSSLGMLGSIAPGLLCCSWLGLEGREESTSGCCYATSHPTLLLAPTHLHGLHLGLLLGGTCGGRAADESRRGQAAPARSQHPQPFTSWSCSCHRGLGVLGAPFMAWLWGLASVRICLAQLLLVPCFLEC